MRAAGAQHPLAHRGPLARVDGQADDVELGPVGACGAAPPRPCRPCCRRRRRSPRTARPAASSSGRIRSQRPRQAQHLVVGRHDEAQRDRPLASSRPRTPSRSTRPREAGRPRSISLASARTGSCSAVLSTGGASARSECPLASARRRRARRTAATRGQHRAVVVGPHERLPGRRVELAQQPPGGVAPAVVHGDVVRAPEPHVGRNGDDQPRAGRRHAAQLGERPPVVVEVLDDVRGEDEVEARVLEGQLLDGRDADVLEPAPPAEGDRLVGEVDARRPGRGARTRPGCARCRSRRRGSAATGGRPARRSSAQITSRRPRNHQCRSSSS